MGMLFRRKVQFCTTCRRRLDKTAHKAECRAAGHRVEDQELPVWWLKYYEGGKPKYESSKTTKKQAAEKILRSREHSIDEGVPIDPQKGKVKFDEAVTYLLTDFELQNRKTKDDADARITLHLKPVFGDRRLASITADEIEAYQVARRKEKASNATINRELALLKRMYRLALVKKKLSHDHVPEISMLEEDNVRQGFFEHAQYVSLLKHLPDTLRPVVTFAYYTGWRIADEVLQLEWRQVDRKAGEVRLDVGETKNKKGRVIYFSPELKSLFDERWKKHEELSGLGILCPYVFARPVQPKGKPKTAKPYSPSGFKKAWDGARVLAGCPGRIPHDLRRTAVRNMVRAGIPESVAMKISGHQTRSVFERYNITSEGDLRDAARKMGDGDTLVTLGAVDTQYPHAARRPAKIS